MLLGGISTSQIRVDSSVLTVNSIFLFIVEAPSAATRGSVQVQSSPGSTASLGRGSPPRSPRKREAEVLLEDSNILPAGSKRTRTSVTPYSGELHFIFSVVKSAQFLQLIIC